MIRFRMQLIVACCLLCLAKDICLAVDFCNMTECKGLKHLGCDNDLTFHKSCRHTHVLINMQMYKEYLLKTHNKYRNDVASGAIMGLSKARQMTELVWHPKLALLAEYHVKRCLQKLSMYCIAMPNFPDPAINYGLNLLDIQSLPSYKPSQHSEELTDQTEQWTHQVHKLAQGELFGNDVHEIRNILNDNNNHVGCAASEDFDDAASRFVLICYYDRKYNANGLVYRKGSFLGKGCPHGISANYPHLCKTLRDANY